MAMSLSDAELFGSEVNVQEESTFPVGSADDNESVSAPSGISIRQFFTSSSRTPSSRRVLAPDTESDDECEPLPRVATQPKKRIRTYPTKKSKCHALVLVKDLVNNTPNRISSGRRKESTNLSHGRTPPCRYRVTLYQLAETRTLRTSDLHCKVHLRLPA